MRTEKPLGTRGPISWEPYKIGDINRWRFESRGNFLQISKFGLSMTSVADLALFWNYTFVHHFFLIFVNRLGLNGLNKNLKITTETENWSKLMILFILDPKTLIWGKFDFFQGLFNPLSATVLIWGRKNHLVLEALYLENHTKSEI